LIEALVALLVFSFSLLAAVKLQTWLRQNGDLAHNRSAAVRQAQQDLEQLRTFRDLTAFDDTVVAHDEQRATTRLQRQVHDDNGLKTVHTTAHWQHRGAGEQSLQLISSIARQAPVYSAALALPPQDQVLVVRRQLPTGARSFPDGRVLFKPTPDSRIVWWIDRLSGDITQQCQVAATAQRHALTAADLTECEPFNARLMRGYIRYALSATPDSLNANDAPLPLAMQMANARCETETVASGTERYILYACAVPPATATDAEPTFAPQGWTFGLTAATFKACRYPHAARAPRNYLIVRGDLDCPSTVPPHNGNPVVTVQHQP
jgi:hypothetical protein